MRHSARTRALLMILIIVGTAMIVLAVSESSVKPCRDGYFWSSREAACIPGYRPGN